jgi:MFS family permease
MNRRFWRIVLLVTVWHIAASACYYAIYAGTPLFRNAFDLSGFEIGLVITALSLGYATSLLPFGIATDRFGERRTLTVGLFGLAVGVLGVTLAPTYWLLLAAAFAVGLMYGSATPGTNKAIFDGIEEGSQHRAIGIKQIGPTAGSAIGAVVVTGLAGLFFWQFGFFLTAAAAAAIAALFLLLYRDSERAEATVPDFRGLLSNRPYVVVLLAGFSIGAAFYTATGYTVLFVEESVGATVAVGGLVLASLQVASSVGRIGAGTLADVLPGAPRTRTGALLFVQATGGGLLFLLLPFSDTVLLAGIAFAGIGLCILGSPGLYYSCISTLVPEDELGAASAMGQLSMTLSGTVAPPIFGYLVDVSGYLAAWGFLGGLSFLAGALLLAVTLELV